MSFDIGEKIRLKAEFTDTSQNPLDPTSIIITVTSPAEVVSTYYYNVGGEADTITRQSLGVFYVDISLDTDGWWIWHCAGDGTVIAVEESTFKVIRKKTS